MRKTNASEPLMTRRKAIQPTSKPSSVVGSGQVQTYTCLRAGRCPAWRQRDPVLRLSWGTWEPVASMIREKSEGEAPEGEEYRCEAQGRSSP